MIQRSPEIESIVRRWASLIREGTPQDLVYFLSEEDALTYVGSSTDEYWRGQIVRDGLTDHLAEVPKFAETDIEIEAFENGDTGWAFYKSRFHFAETGATGIHRITYVFVLERGAWKIIQHHISQPDSNLDKIGIEHEAFSALIEAAKQGLRFDHRIERATVMFTDVVDSTAMAAQLGDRAWAAAISKHFELTKDLVEHYDGQVVKSLGDGTMSTFSSAAAALAAARGLQMGVADTLDEPPLHIRIGLHSGDVVETRDDFFGSVVNKAARIAEMAAPGEIRLSDTTRIAADGPEFCFADPVSKPLKGFQGNHVIYGLDWRNASAVGKS